jgi:alkaline phosphatase D
VTTTPLPIPRRSVLATGAAGTATIAATSLAPQGAEAAGHKGDRYFRHGVASGDPLPHGIVLWTRVTPTPAASPGSGKGPRVKVGWEVAADKRFRKVVRRGTFATGASRDHTVKVEVGGLKPERWYYYRFTYRDAHSRTGRLRTAPAPSALPDNLRFAVASCANWQAGFFGAYRGIADRDDLHAVIHLGDYYYEYAPTEYGEGMDDSDVRPHVPAKEITTLADYRQRHAQYKSDPDLQDAHAKFPWIVTWDDHETANDTWSGGAENHQPETEGDFLQRRAQAHRAYDEWMPVRMNGTAALGDGDRLFRRLRFGQLMELSMLDLRTYRDRAVETPAVDPAVSDPARTITGAAQMEWLKQSLTRSAPQWRVVGNPVMIAPLGLGGLPDTLIGPINTIVNAVPEDGATVNTDQWDGYTADRTEVFTHIRDHQVSDVVFITGDIHSAWAADLPYDASTYPLVGDTAGVEFVCTSVTSNNLKDALGTPGRSPVNLAAEQAILAVNRHIKYLNFDDHGFCVLDVTPERAQMDWFIIGSRTERNTPITWTRSFATKAGTGRIAAVDRPVGR